MKRAVVILLAVTLDLALGDPPNRFHPLLLMGRWLSWGRRLAPPRRRFWFVAGWMVVGAALFALPFWKTESRRRTAKCDASNNGIIFHTGVQTHAPARSAGDEFCTPVSILSFVLHSVLLKPVFAYRNLRRAVIEVSQAIEADDLPEARHLLSWHLVSRDTSQLGEAEVAGAAIESLAENLTDSLTAPLMAYAMGGLPAAWTYRFVNTADAMWGYRNPEFEQLGKFPARLDDALNWLPARLTGWLLVLAAWLARENGRGAARTMLAQHDRTASLNAGWTMSAMAGALDITLSKQDVYELVGGQVEPDASTIKRALRVADICVGLNMLLLIAAIPGRAVARKRPFTRGITL